MLNNIYYVYSYLREDGTPYYIGKGKNKRVFSTNKNVIVPKDKTRIVLIKENLSEKEAHELEVQLIAKYGRKDNGTGILRNLTDGGEGASGCIRSKESRINYSKSKIGNNNPMYGMCGEKNPFYGRKHSIETKKKISKSRRGKINGSNNPFYGKKHSNETKLKISKTKKEGFRKNKHPRLGAKLSEETKKIISNKIKGKRWFHNPTTNSRIYCNPDCKPLNFLPGMGKKKP